MAPFVEMEWGKQAYALMREIKGLFDPLGLLNPGVILTEDPLAHVHHLKPIPAAFADVDKCIECGLCEGKCPSRGLTLTPRQRIAGWREITRQQALGVETRTMERLFDDLGIDTCAACGLCSLMCPVAIDTGRLIRALRGTRRGRLARGLSRVMARRFSWTLGAVRAALAAAHVSRRVFGPGAVEKWSLAVRRVGGTGIPRLLPSMPNPTSSPAFRLGAAAPQRETVVYVPACPNRTFGPSDLAEDRRPLPEVISSLLAKAGIDIVIPPGLDDLCCGLAFASKGLEDIAASKAGEMAAAIAAASGVGPLPVVLDASPCSLRMKERLAGRVPVHDLPEFLHDVVLPRLDVTRCHRPVVVHIPCSAQRMGVQAKLVALAEACSDQVSVPDDITCCGFAGDKGFFRPDLNEHALRHWPQTSAPGTVGCSSSRTCEIGLERHAGHSVQSIAYLLDRCSSPKL
jgi:D-lactate dehydrogenase